MPRGTAALISSAVNYMLLTKQAGASQLAALELTPGDNSFACLITFRPHFEAMLAQYPFMLNIITLMSLGPMSAAANMPTLQEISGMTVGETWDSWLEMNPETAAAQGLNDKDEVWIESPFGKVKTKVRFVKALHPDVVNLPYNQGHTAVGRWAKGRGVNGLALLRSCIGAAFGTGLFYQYPGKGLPCLIGGQFVNGSLSG